MTRVFASPCSHACCNAQTGAFVVKMDGIARSTSDGNYPVSFRGVIDGLQRQGSSNPTGRYEALDASAVRGALSAAEHRGNRLYFCTVAWKLGHDLIDRQEHWLAAECFGRLWGFAASVADGFVLEAARIAERICAVLCEGREVGPGTREALEVLRRDLSQLTYEELSVAAAALAPTEDDEKEHEGCAPSSVTDGYYFARRTGTSWDALTPSDGVKLVDRREEHQQRARLCSRATLLELEVRFFFPFEVLHEGRTLPLGHNCKAQMILRYLLAHASRSVSQDHLMGWLWPDSSLKKARWSLNSAMCAVRKLLAEAPSARPAESYVLFEAGYYRLSPCVRVASDVQEFDASYRNGCYLEGAGQVWDAAGEYKRAIELYRGDYLVEDLYQDWTMVERERLSNAYVNMLWRLAVHYAESGQPQESIRACYRILEKDRCHEDSYRLLMRSYARLGLRCRALRQYQLCERILRQEYGTVPSPETQTLHRSIILGEETS